jgi:putative membrane protein
LIRDNVPSAAIALGLNLLGFVLPVVSAIAGDTSRFLPRAIL